MPPTCADGGSGALVSPRGINGTITDRDSSLDELISWLMQSGAEINAVIVRNVEGSASSNFTLIQVPVGDSSQRATLTRERP